ncbi:hypothetical protein K9U34_02170 [Lawsonia intracellularis]|uniref:hypothetical protein n=1 Tax=Lawsonia intracellularis TaxID=29546 RepID=UPI0002ADBBF9|nr:hypothetical protein [Lawsonia intracellularis]AGC49543.1 hypothetical protein LAW_00142 [Lawsonia intracellularis N343]KAA0205065.1 hypothetical protein C4K43_00980 [Lawsonia intracellularis]MBZ3892409.1 hypothetical protein [Lawsonia intracellularis]OMQ06205.1 hypothetical protein BW722_00815 [Lawsonia intracellularis]RBN32387.1 hypothetical protein DR194_05395 [Lawsonia intracellularis]
MHETFLITLGTILYSLAAFGCAIYFTYRDKNTTAIIGFLVLSLGLLLINKLAGNISEVQIGNFTLRAEQVIDNLENKANHIIDKMNDSCDEIIKKIEKTLDNKK